MNPEAHKIIPETVADAAVLYEGKVFQGTTHGHALGKLLEYLKGADPDLYTKVGGEEYGLVEELEHRSPGTYDFEGFVTSTGRYINRTEANTIAERNGQRIGWKPPGSDLYSEELRG